MPSVTKAPAIIQSTSAASGAVITIPDDNPEVQPSSSNSSNAIPDEAMTLESAKLARDFARKLNTTSTLRGKELQAVIDNVVQPEVEAKAHRKAWDEHAKASVRKFKFTVEDRTCWGYRIDYGISKGRLVPEHPHCPEDIKSLGENMKDFIAATKLLDIKALDSIYSSLFLR